MSSYLMFDVAAARGEGEGSKHRKGESPNLHCFHCFFVFNIICLCLSVCRVGKSHATGFGAVHLLFRSSLLCRLMARYKHENIGEQYGDIWFFVKQSGKTERSCSY